MRWFGHVEHSDGRIAQVCKLYRRDNGGQKKTWEEVLQDGKKKLGMDLATLKTGLIVEVVREEVLSESPTLGTVEENGLLPGYDDVIMMK